MIEMYINLVSQLLADHRLTHLLVAPALASLLIIPTLPAASVPILVLSVAGLCVLSMFADGAEAETREPGWGVTSTTFPTDLAPAGGTGTIEVNVYNVGAEKSNNTVTVTDTLPAGIIATEAGDVQNAVGEGIGEDGLWDCSVGNGEVVKCVNDPERLRSLPIPEATQPGHQKGAGSILHIGIAVKVETGTPGTLTNHVTVAGGGAFTSASTTAPITIDSSPASSFGFQESDGWFSSADGMVDTQAGSHPYAFTYSFDLNTKFEPELEAVGGEPQNFAFKLPPGFVGNPTAVPECTRQQFEEEVCPPQTQVGIDVADLEGVLIPGHFAFPVYNLVPPSGIPAQFALQLAGIDTFLDAGVRSGGDYGITVNADNITQAKKVMGNRVTFWGEPSDPSHNEYRYANVDNCEHGCSSSAPRIPFLTLPTSCEGPQTFTAGLNTWETAGFGEASFETHDSNGAPTGFTGCYLLGFGPSISVAPDTSDADTPAGLTVDVRVPQEGLSTTGALATSNIKDTTVVLPKGLVINPGQAAGLQACQQGDVPGGDDLPLPGENGEEERFDGPPDCPGAAKVGTVQLTTPLLKENLEGDVYVLQSNPPHLKLLIAMSGEGVNVKLVAETSLCENTGEKIDARTCEAPGQLITTLKDAPELPFTDFKLSFNTGAQAALDTPTQCGEYKTTTDFTPWSTPAVGDVSPLSTFAISSGPGGSPCPSSPPPFGPSLIAGVTSDQAGGFTSFSTLLQNGDGQQRIHSLRIKLPKGLVGMLSKVALCPEPEAEEGTCSEASKIGHATVASGPGSYPLVIPQPGEPPANIYLTGPYDGAPFGASIVTPVRAGPFNLGVNIVRAKIEVDPLTAQVTFTTDPSGSRAIPQVLDGVPTDLRTIDAVIDRPEFIFNPTNCSPQEVSGTAYSGEGASAPISSRFQVGSCQSLKFAPDFKVSTAGKTSKKNGASLDAKVLYPTGALGANQASSQANVAYVKVDLPKQLPARLTTLQKACTAAQFETNPAGCPAASVVGHATAITPVLPVPVSGPAYFVSYGGAKFPELVIVLQGYGVTVYLRGETFIKAGITSSTFKTVPDVPITSFDLTLPQGPFSALAANGDLCTSTLAMPTKFIGQNGAVLKQSTKISATGCAKTKTLTRAQKLVRALRACHIKHNKKRRVACETAARKRYGPVRRSQRAKGRGGR